jgi:hypothetical protein
MMVIASFCAERGDINSKTTYKEGKWGILAKVPFK